MMNPSVAAGQDKVSASPLASAGGLADTSGLVGGLPYRLALAGGWIDQPFVSRIDPNPPGSMTVVSVEPDFRFMERSGMATSTRRAAERLWGPCLPDRDPASLVRELYAAENEGRREPSGAQDMVGICYPGVSRMDFDAAVDGGVFPVRVETKDDPQIASWIERVIRILPVAQRPAGYNPLEVKRIDAFWVRRLGGSGRECWDAIISRDLRGLGHSFNETMEAWVAMLPGTVDHHSIDIDLAAILAWYRKEYGSALYSGCGGGYLFVPTEREVPGSFGIRVRRAPVRGCDGGIASENRGGIASENRGGIASENRGGGASENRGGIALENRGGGASENRGGGASENRGGGA